MEQLPPGDPLAAAVETGKLPCTRLLVEHGADVNTDIQFGEYGSPLAVAIAIAELECAQFLVERGANANANLNFDRCGSSLAVAASKGDLDSARCLVESGADINAYPEFGECGSVLAAAIIGSHELAVIKFLVEEAHADLFQLSVVQPRSQDSVVCRCGGYCRIAAYLVQGRRLNALTLISVGFSQEDIPSDID